MLQQRHRILQLRLLHQTGSVSPGATTLTMKQASKFSGKKGLRERISILGRRQRTSHLSTIAPLQMALCITTGYVRPTRLETLRFQMKRTALHRWQNRPLPLQRQYRQVASTLPGLIIRPLRQATRLNARKRRLGRMHRWTRWVQMCKATAIQMDLSLTQDITTGSELPTGRLTPTTRMHRRL